METSEKQSQTLGSKRHTSWRRWIAKMEIRGHIFTLENFPPKTSRAVDLLDDARGFFERIGASTLQ